MDTFRSVRGLDTSSLCSLLAGGSPALHELSRQEWLGTEELLNGRLAEDPQAVAGESAESCLRAVEYVVACAVESGALSRRDALVRQVNLCRVLLRSVPASTGDDVLNPDRLVRGALDEVTTTPEEAERLSADWRSLPVAEIRRLRDLRSLLRPVVALTTETRVADDLADRVRPWARVVPMLP